MLFSFVAQVLLLLCRITWSSFSTCKSCHCTADGLTFSDPIHKKSARNLNLYDFCHSPKKLAAVSPFNKAQYWTTIYSFHYVPVNRKSRNLLQLNDLFPRLRGPTIKAEQLCQIREGFENCSRTLFLWPFEMLFFLLFLPFSAIVQSQDN
jgi:hypothetical protein